jgi:hypothetical protein
MSNKNRLKLPTIYCTISRQRNRWRNYSFYQYNQPQEVSTGCLKELIYQDLICFKKK